MDRKKIKNIIFLTIIVAILVSVLILVRHFTFTSTDNINQPPAEAGDRKSSQQHRPTEKSIIHESEKQLPQQFDSPAAQDHAITGVIHYSSLDGSTLIIRSTIHQLLSTGTCTITITDDKTTLFKQEAPVVQNPSSSSCMGFDVPASQLGKGQRNITITVRSGDKSGVLTGITTI